jgi:hypothetical protein
VRARPQDVVVAGLAERSGVFQSETKELVRELSAAHERAGGADADG